MKPKKRREDWRVLTAKGVELLQQGQAQQALTELLRARRLAPNERDVIYWLANASRMTGDTDRAAKLFRKLLLQRPNDFEASFALAFLLREIGLPGEAAESLLAASEQPGLSEEQLLQVAGFLRDSNQYDAAITVCEKVVALRPNQPDLHFKLGRLYQATGAFDKALIALRKTLELQPATGPAWTVLSQQKKFASIDDPDLIRLERAAGRSQGDEADMCVAFAYGKALDDLQRWPEAWGQYQKGNQLASRAMPWNAEAWTAFVERAKVTRPRKTTHIPQESRAAVFVVGMPRSGTTLLEQLLDRHPQISGRGELNFLDHFAKQVPSGASVNAADRTAMADVLWTQLRLEGQDNGVYIDKNPLNFRHLDLLFELLPSARVLHVTRDPRDTCLSCYFQLFEHEDAAFSNSLENLLSFYRGYRQLMAHWESIYAERIHTVQYEDLVACSGTTLAATLQFLGVAWDDAVTQAAKETRAVRTASVWQARQPIHSGSVERWRHYESQAQDFLTDITAIERQFERSATDPER